MSILYVSSGVVKLTMVVDLFIWSPSLWCLLLAQMQCLRTITFGNTLTFMRRSMRRVGVFEQFCSASQSAHAESDISENYSLRIRLQVLFQALAMLIILILSSCNGCSTKLVGWTLFQQAPHVIQLFELCFLQDVK